MSDVARFFAPDQVHILVYAGLLLLASQVGGRVASLLNAPRVTGYLVVGILLGPSVFGVLSRDLVSHDMALVTDIALAIIAFSIGGSLALPKLKRLGGEARNWSVVSSDQEVRAAARASRAVIISAEDFASQLVEVSDDTGIEPSDSESELSAQEVEDWMRVFGVEEEDED